MKKIIYLVVLGILMFNLVQAVSVDIDVASSFSEGETTHFNYTIISSVDEEVIFIPRIFCEKSLVKPLEQIEIDLVSSIPYKNIHFDKVVDSSLEPQECTASVLLISPIQKTVSKNFSIITEPSFPLKLIIDKKIFLKGELINLDYDSSGLSPKTTATLILPDETTEDISLPYNFKPEEVGTYTIEVIASREGYKTIIVREQFGVIENEAYIPTTEPETIDEIKPEVETYAEEAEPEDEFYYDFSSDDNSKWWIIGITILAILILMFFLWKYFKRAVTPPSKPRGL